MTISSSGRVVGVVAIVVAAITAPEARQAIGEVVADDFPVAALAAAQLGALLTSGWVLLILLGGVVHVHVPGVPASLRALLFTAVVVTAVAGPAHADPTHHLDGLTLPDRPTSARAPAVSPAPAAAATPGVLVRSGDTLWGIAGEHLPSDASATDIARAVSRWYDTNRRTIGPDPDLIVPGQALHAPTTEQDDS